MQASTDKACFRKLSDWVNSVSKHHADSRSIVILLLELFQLQLLCGAANFESRGLKPNILEGVSGTAEAVPFHGVPRQYAQELASIRILFCFFNMIRLLALQIVLDIHRGCTSDYAAGREPYLVWFTRFQEKPALALPHLRWL